MAKQSLKITNFFCFFSIFENKLTKLWKFGEKNEWSLHLKIDKGQYFLDGTIKNHFMKIKEKLDPILSVHF
jgi:hypothetical protein